MGSLSHMHLCIHRAAIQKIYNKKLYNIAKIYIFIDKQLVHIMTKFKFFYSTALKRYKLKIANFVTPNII